MRASPGARSSTCRPSDGERLDAARVRAAVADVPGARVVAVKASSTRSTRASSASRVAGAARRGRGPRPCSRSPAQRAPARSPSRCRSPRRRSSCSPRSTLAGVALGILHLVGLLLTVAIGSNYALFFDHLREQRRGRQRHARLAAARQPDDGRVVRPARELAHPGAAGGRRRRRPGSVPLPRLLGGVARPPRRRSGRRDAWENRRVTTTPGDGLLAASGTPPAAAPAARRGRATSRRASPGISAAGAAAAVVPARWPWALGAIAANHLVLTAGGLWPRSRWLGSNWTRLPADAAARGEVAITIDDGPDPELTPAILDLLDAAPARAPPSSASPRARAPIRACAGRSSPAATASRTTATATRTASRCSGRAPWRARSPPRRRAWPTSPARRRASFALRPGCATPSWRRCCSGSTCSW